MRHVIIAAWLCIAIQSSAADTVTLRYGQIPSTVRSVSTLYLFIAQQKGFLAREGIKLELVPIAGGTDKMVAALDRGAVDVTQTATPYLIRAVLSGSDATAIAGETANPVYSLIVKPQIQSFAELRGKTLGLSLPVDTISISMRKLLALNGLGEGDYSVKELVGTPVRFECLKRGECDAVPLGQPEDFIAIGDGVPQARSVDGCGGGVPIPGHCGAASVGADEQGCGCTFRAWTRRGVSVHPRPRQSGGGGDGNRRIDRLVGPNRASDARALFRAG
jgi:ABC-type nitrate/sulfonate/bicarbonate transport system substrate-binding protein